MRRKGGDSVTVTLIRPHEHAGERHAAGARLTVRRALVPTLERFGVIEAGGPSAGEPEPAPEPTSEPAAPGDPEPMGPTQ